MSTVLWKLTTHTAQAAVLCLRKRTLTLRSFFPEEAGSSLRGIDVYSQTMKGIPLAYNKDMQEDKELTFDAIDTVKGCLALFTGMVSTMRILQGCNGSKCKEQLCTNATDAADYLVNHGVPFQVMLSRYCRTVGTDLY